LAITFVVPLPARAAAAKRPNILFILVDDPYRLWNQPGDGLQPPPEPPAGKKKPPEKTEVARSPITDRGGCFSP
jgi:hypothetical protein